MIDGLPDTLRHRLAHARLRLLDAVHLPITFYLGYVGVTTLIRGRESTPTLTALLPEWLTYAWSSALVLGALLIILGVAGDRTRAESAGHGFHLFGIGLYVAVNLALIDGDGVVVIVVLAAVSLMRLRILARSRAARGEAARILNGGPP